MGRRYTTQAIIRSPSNAPDRMFVKLKTGFYGQWITGAAGAYDVIGYIRLNSAFDPLGDLGAVTPAGSTPLLGASGSAVYGAYIVHAASISWKIMQTTNSGCTVCALIPRCATAAEPASMGRAISTPRAKYGMVGPAEGVVNLYTFNTTAQLYGQSPQTVATDDTYSALYNATPTSEVRCDFALASTDNNQQTVNVVVVLTQWCELFGRWTVV